MVLVTNQSQSKLQLRLLVLPLRHGLPVVLSPVKVAKVLTGISLVSHTQSLQRVNKVLLSFTRMALRLPVPIPVAVKHNPTQYHKELLW
jgi:hypothetical protein